MSLDIYSITQTILICHQVTTYLCLIDLCILRTFLLLTVSPQISQFKPGWFSRWVASMFLVMLILPEEVLSQIAQCQALSPLYIMVEIWASSWEKRSKQNFINILNRYSFHKTNKQKFLHWPTFKTVQTWLDKFSST